MSLSGCIAECLCGSYLLNTRPIAALSDATSTILLCLVLPDRDPDTMMTKIRERDSGSACHVIHGMPPSFLVNARAVAPCPRKHMALEDPIQIIEERE